MTVTASSTCPAWAASALKRAALLLLATAMLWLQLLSSAHAHEDGHSEPEHEVCQICVVGKSEEEDGAGDQDVDGRDSPPGIPGPEACCLPGQKSGSHAVGGAVSQSPPGTVSRSDPARAPPAGI